MITRTFTHKQPLNGHTKQVLFFFPISNYVRALYARPDLVPFLHADRECSNEGSVLRSRGFRKKVIENDHLNDDHRNLGVIGTCDGVPFFDDQKRGAWVFVQRCGNLPGSLSMHRVNCHLHMISANAHWEEDKGANVLRRKVRGPKSLQPHMMVLADDLLGAYNRGIAASRKHTRNANITLVCKHYANYTTVTLTTPSLQVLRLWTLLFQGACPIGCSSAKLFCCFGRETILRWLLCQERTVRSVIGAH